MVIKIWGTLYNIRHLKNFMKHLLLVCAFAIIACGVNAQEQTVKDICSGIERFTDDSTHQVKMYSPGMWDSTVVPLIFSKWVTQDTVSFSLYLSTRTDMVLKNGKGVIVIFTDSTIWTRPAKINTYPINNLLEYNTDLTLTEADVLLFSTKKIAKYMLYIFNQEIDKATADNFQAAVKCIIESH